MPIRMSRDDAAKRIVAVGEGEFQGQEFVDFLGSMRESGAWTYDVLLDLRGMRGEPKVGELRPIMATSRAPDEAGAARGRLAIVATSVLYGIACAYAALGKPGRVAVFRDRDQADLWLARKVAPPGRIAEPDRGM